MLKLSDIKNWDTDTIDSKVSEIRRELFEMRMQKTTSGVDKPHKFKTLKRDIARLLTVRSQGVASNGK